MMRFLLVFLLAAAAHGACTAAPGVTLHSEFTGGDSCLDIVNSGNLDKVRMANCGNFSGQLWEITPDADYRYVRLRTRFTGTAMCLDATDNGGGNQVRMAQCANVSGQQWRIEQAGQGAARLSNQFAGEFKCLDIANDSSLSVHLAPCGDYSGQYWHIHPRRPG
jgi:hypothetical protein